MVINPFRILELPVTDDDKFIKEAYKLRAWELHPDVCPLPESGARFLELKEAYEAALEKSAGRRKLGMEAFRQVPWRDQDQLEELLRTARDPRLRAGALRRLINLKNYRALPLIRYALDSEEPALLWSAVHGLGRLEIKSFLPLICRLYPEQDLAIRLVILRFAKAMGSSEGDQLSHLAWDDPDFRVRRYSEKIYDKVLVYGT